MTRIITLLALAVVLAACGTKTVQTPKDAEYHLSEGERLYEKKLYKDAIASWEKVLESYDSIDLVIKAELKIAEAHYRAGNYVEASVAYESFLKNHPDYEKEADVLFKLGRSYYHQILSIDRDQTATRNARRTMENFLARFPDHPRTEEARKVIEECERKLADHEIYIGRFYLRTGEYQAAIKRLEAIPQNYPDVSGLDKALYYLGLSHARSGEEQAAEKAFNRLFENHPDSPFTDKARKVVASEL
ncbi:MAG TPA: outer membrane protein assembly factor BamD [Desulfuromonadales bacterium]|nr:outer membrane protein assembly factor BamD [Desulfuromonadales bacterium]